MESTNNEEKPVTTVNKLHFLIHPGFLRDPETDFINEKESDDHEKYKQWDSLLQSYVDKAQKVPNDEIVIVMMHATFRELLRDFRNKSAYTKTLSVLKDVLGKRMIALSNDNNIEEDESYIVAEKIANARGFDIPKDVYSDAYGETLGACVPIAASTANRALHLSAPTLLIPELTDEPQIPKNYEQQILDEYDRVIFALTDHLSSS